MTILNGPGPVVELNPKRPPSVGVSSPRIVLTDIPLGFGNELNGLAISYEGACALWAALDEGISEYERLYPRSA